MCYTRECGVLGRRAHALGCSSEGVHYIGLDCGTANYERGHPMGNGRARRRIVLYKKCVHRLYGMKCFGEPVARLLSDL